MNTLDVKSLRKEMKFKIFNIDQSIFINWLLGSSNFCIAYSDREISSIYYDTLDYKFAYSNMTGESNRTKLRVRWYPKQSNLINENADDNFITCVLERKRKSNDSSDKTILGKKIFKNFNCKINQLNELSSWVNQMSSIDADTSSSFLKETILITYNRKYYRHILFPNVRLTIDSNITFRDINTSMKDTLISKNFFVIELKYQLNDEYYAKSIMENSPFRRTRFSKYLSAMTTLKHVSY